MINSLSNLLSTVSATFGPRRRRRKPGRIESVEQLQVRQLLTATAFVDGDTLFIEGTEQADHVTVLQSMNDDWTEFDLQVVVMDEQFGDIIDLFTFDQTVVTQVEMNLFGGDDSIANSSGVTSTIFLGSGDDRYSGFSFGSATVFGGAGNDLIITSRDAGFVASDPLRDLTPEEITALIDQSLTNGEIDSDDHHARRIGDLPDEYRAWTGLDEVDDDVFVLAAWADETIIQTINDHTGINLAGFKSVYGESGNDDIHGGPRADVLFGGDGNDVILGYQGDDLIDAGNGFDRAWGDEGNDNLFGGDDYDRLFGGDDNDFLDGGAGHDHLYGDDGLDELLGGAGDDNLIGGAGADVLSGGDGDDRIAGDDVEYFDETIYWQSVASDDAGDDVLDGGNGGDLLIGGGGADSLVGGMGPDRLFGDQAPQLGFSWSPTLEHDSDGVDTLNGGEGDDLLVGGGQSDELTGGTGNDSLIGASGSDFLDGGLGHDQLFGDHHESIIWEGIWNHLGGSNPLMDGGDDELIGGEGDDLLVGGGGNDTLRGHAGNDTLDGGVGNDNLLGDAGDDVLVGDSPVLSPVGLIVVPVGNDTLDGGLGDDWLSGQAGDDLLVDHSGFNVLSGDDGDDTFESDLARIQIDDGVLTVYGTEESDQISLNIQENQVWVTWSTAHEYEYRVIDPSLVSSLQVISYAGDDYIYNTTGISSLIMAGDGWDNIFLEGGDHTVYAGAGNDDIYSGDGNDVLFGEDGYDYVHGGGGNDILDGGLGDDTLFGGEGDDEHYGGEGVDEMTDDSSPADTFDQDGEYTPWSTSSPITIPVDTTPEETSPAEESGTTTGGTSTTTNDDVADAQAAAKRYGLTSVLTKRENWGGLNEKWFQSKGKDLFFITPDRVLYRWNGSKDLSTSKPVAKLGRKVFARPELILGAAMK